ncbi:unnamed protein product, partial [Polarella glacialis]
VVCLFVVRGVVVVVVAERQGGGASGGPSSSEVPRMSAQLPEISASRSQDAKILKSKSSNSKFSASSQARFGYIGNLSLQGAEEDGADALRNVAALDGPSFLPNVMTLQRASTPWQYNTPSRMLEAPWSDNKPSDEPAERGMGNSTSRKALDSQAQPMPANY